MRSTYIIDYLVSNVYTFDHFSHGVMEINCHHCREIISWLEGRELGRTVRCPICEAMYMRGCHCVVDEEGRPVNEDREKRGRHIVPIGSTRSINQRLKRSEKHVLRA